MWADVAERQLRLAVTELYSADRVERPGGSAGVRAWIGQALHVRYQRAAERTQPDYQAERPLVARFAHGDWTVTLRGRADGVARDADGVLRVEELKSVWPDEEPPRDTRSAWERQLRTYAWLLARETGEPVRAEIVRLPIGHDDDGAPAAVREALAWDADRMDEAIRAAVEAWVQLALDRAATAAERAAAAREIALPHAAWRPGQDTLAEGIARALDEREQLLVQAPTGLGKTLAALVPALRMALRDDLRLIVTSATGLGQRTAREALASIAPPALPLATRIRKREAMCTNDQVLCHPAACDAARDHVGAVRRNDLPGRLLDEATMLEPDAVFEAARAAGACPFQVSLDAARRLPVTICDLNYLFDPGNQRTLVEESDLPRTVVIVDEVHRLAPRIRDALTIELDSAMLRRAAERASFGGADVHVQQARLCHGLADRVEATVAELVGTTEPGAPFEATVELPRDLLEDLRGQLDLTLLATLAYRHDTRAWADDDPFWPIWAAARGFAETFAADASYGSLALGTKQGVALRRVCVDAAPWIGPVLEGAHAFVGLSATLEPRELHESNLGLSRERAVHMTVGDPFPPESRSVVIDPSIDTRLAARGHHAPKLARKLLALADAVPGGCLALLPSHAYLAEVAAHLGSAATRVHAQGPETDLRARQELVEQLERGDGLVLGVAGGVLAESLDLPAGALSAVAVVGPCLPPPSAARRLLEEHYDERAGEGFAWAHVAPGMTRVIQAAGRLVRRPTDRGVIALFGRRFLRDPYRSALPEAWFSGRAPEDCVGDPAEEALRFFGEATS